ncbi:MAG: ATP-binding cassette domain-containing protein [Candidatus Pacebacteria bacterium]|nr:ATP-binding cassette domain-containing protein [Candidatus Paceibacterota bacterium]
MSTNQAISVQNLTKTFKGGFEAVKDVSFEVPKGSTFAFLGPNGAGKTTTIRMLTTLLAPTSGTITINGFDPSKDPHAVRKSCGIVFQDASLDDDLSAYENMAFHAGIFGVPKSEAKTSIEELLRFVELWDRKDDFVKNFSGGMKRRLEIARGLLHTPAVLFLDEPTVGLDPQTRNHIWSYIKKLNAEKGLTVFFTTHYMDEVERVADHVVVIDHGGMVASDTVQGIISKNGGTTLEDAFIKLTGHDIREESVDSVDHLRSMRKMFGGNKK